MSQVAPARRNPTRRAPKDNFQDMVKNEYLKMSKNIISKLIEQEDEDQKLVGKTRTKKQQTPSKKRNQSRGRSTAPTAEKE